MPIYEYYCPQCRAGFEKLRPMGASDAEVVCPQCGSRVRKLISVVAAVSRSDSSGVSRLSSGGGGCGCGGNCGCGGHHGRHN